MLHLYSWEQIDANGGIAPAVWLAKLRARRRLPGTSPTLAGLLMTANGDSFRTPIETLRALLIRGVSYQSNKAVKKAVADGGFVELNFSEAAAAAILDDLRSRLEEHRTKAMESIAESTRWQRANYVVRG